ncbi:MAG: T9SS type A sorting domain-containing protein, partial [Cyclobacteriaceae bacterium]
YKLLKWAERDRIEMFDLKNDLSEVFNLAKQEPNVADSLENLLDVWLNSTGAVRATANPNYNNNPVTALEAFDYHPGDALEARNGGRGWVYNWVNERDSFITISPQSLDYDSINSTGGSLQLDTQSEDISYYREFLNLVENEPDYWTSFLIRYTEEGNFSFSWLDAEFVPAFSIENASNSGFDLINHQNNFSEGFNISIGSTHLLVAQVTGFSNSDSVLLWVDPPLGQLPTQGNANAVITDLDLTNGIGGISLRADQGFSGTIDEIKNGFSFGDISLFYTPSSLPVDVREPFTYTIGENIIDKGTDTLGWAGRWQNSGNLAGNSITIEEGNLWEKDTLGEVQSHVKLSYVENNTQIRIDRNLEKPIISDGSTYWISYWTDTEASTALGNVANFNLVNSAISANGGHRLSIGRLYGNGKIGLITPSNGVRSNSDVDDLGLNHLVIRIRTVDSGEIADTVHLWINPVIDQPLNLATAATWMPTRVLKDGADVIRLRVEGAGAGQVPLTVSFDHLRIGRSQEIARLFDVEKEEIVLSANSNKLTDQVIIYPNPSDGKIYFKNLPSKIVSATLFSMSGQKILEDKIASNKELLIEYQLKPGVYPIHFKGSNGETLQVDKLIIK